MASVLVVCEFPTLHGGENSLLSVVPHLRRAGFDVAAAAPPAGPLAEALAERNVEVIPFEVRDRAGVRRGQEVLRRELADLLRRRRPDLLHANSLAMGRLSGPAAAEAGLPSIAHLRDIIGLSAAAAADLNRHTRLLAVSEATREAHRAQGVAAEKMYVLYNGVDLERFHPAQRSGWLHAELGLDPRRDRLVGTIGQLVLRKGQDVLAQAAAALARRFPHAHCVLVGSRYSEKDEARRYEAGLREAFAAAGLARQAHFLGTRGDVARLLIELDVLAHPARQEPLGRVLLEAAASGVAVVASDVGGTREVFPEGCGAAVLVRADDAAALALAVGELLDNPARCQQMGAAARRRAEEAFGAKAAAAGLARHWAEVLAGG